MKPNSPSSSPDGLGPFLQGLKIKVIRLRHLTVESENEFSHSQMANFEYDLNMSIDKGDFGLRSNFRVDVRLTSGGDAPVPLANMSAQFAAYYESRIELTEEFEGALIFMSRQHIWPYFRELFDSVAFRCNWPKTTVPLMVVNVSPGRPGGRHPPVPASRKDGGET